MDEMHGYGKGFWETRLKKWFKQLFCKHLYKEDKSRRELLLEGILEPIGGTGFYDTYDIFVVYSKCLKCDKNTIEKARIPTA